jgi:hypothetical protein
MCDRVFRRHRGQRLDRSPPCRIARAVGREQLDVDAAKNAKRMQLAGDTMPFVGGVTDQEHRRLGSLGQRRRLGLDAQRPSSRIAAQQAQMERGRRRTGHGALLFRLGRCDFAVESYFEKIGQPAARSMLATSIKTVCRCRTKRHRSR